MSASRLVVPADGRIMRVSAVGWMVAVAVVSVAARARPGWVVSLAASPERVREGKLWYLVSSGMLVDRPIAISLVCFVVLGVLALLVCGVATFWQAVFLGQVAATIFVYAAIGVIRWIVPAAFQSAVSSPDFGVSTISAAWLGAIAVVGWRSRGQTRAGKCWIAVSCVAAGLFAYSVRPDITALSSEHPVAFVLGVAAASPGLWTTVLEAAWWRPLAMVQGLSVKGRHRRTLLVLAGAPVLLAVAAAPAGVAALRHEIAVHLPPTETRCVLEWNSLHSSPRAIAEKRPDSTVSVATSRITIVRGFGWDARPPAWADYCRFAFGRGTDATVVLGRWRHGRIDTWTTAVTTTTFAPRTGNASIRPDGRLRLVRRYGPRLTLPS
jgi:hypothetical protein